MNNVTITVTVNNRELLDKYFSNKEDEYFVQIKEIPSPEGLLDKETPKPMGVANIHGPSLYLKEVIKMMEENPKEYIIAHYHFEDEVYEEANYTGDHYIYSFDGKIYEEEDDDE